MSDIRVVEAATPAHLEQAAALLRDYLLWMRRRYHRHGDLIDRYFDARTWAGELADLAGHYDAIVVAYVDDVPGGCVMMRALGDGVCEMKRLFVRPAFQGLGLARTMVGELLRLSCERGYRRMRLETGALQTEAQALYRSMGFKPIAPYYACPQYLVKNGRFFESRTCGLATSPPARERVAA